MATPIIFGVGVVFDEGFEQGHEKKNAVAKPDDIDGMRLNILYAANE